MDLRNSQTDLSNYICKLSKPSNLNYLDQIFKVTYVIQI